MRRFQIPVLMLGQIFLVAGAHAISLAGNTSSSTLQYQQSSPLVMDGGVAALTTVTTIGANSAAAIQAANLINLGTYGLTASASSVAASGIVSIGIHTLIEHTAAVEADITATYIGTGTYSWIQVVTTNVPLPGKTSPCIDVPIGSTDPFYPYQSPTGSGVTMEDGATRSKPLMPSVPPTTGPLNQTTWSADLLLAQVSGTSISIMDGVHWGFTLTPWQVPVPPGGDSIVVNPVPEPSSLAVLAPGILLVLRRRSRNRAKSRSKS